MINLRRWLAIIRLTEWFENQVFIRFSDDQSAFIYTKNCLWISRFTIGDEQRNVVLQLRNVAPLSWRVLDIPMHGLGTNKDQSRFGREKLNCLR